MVILIRFFFSPVLIASCAHKNKVQSIFGWMSECHSLPSLTPHPRHAFNFDPLKCRVSSTIRINFESTMKFHRVLSSLRGFSHIVIILLIDTVIPLISFFCFFNIFALRTLKHKLGNILPENLFHRVKHVVALFAEPHSFEFALASKLNLGLRKHFLNY